MTYIDIYINVAIIGSVDKVLSELINRIKISGLYQETRCIYFILNGNKSLLNCDLSDEKFIVMNPNIDVYKCEFPTLDFIWNRCRECNDDVRILYLHTKGVTRPDFPTIIDWTNYMSYFNINLWRDRLLDLQNYDCTGVNLGGNPDDIFFHPVYWGYGKAPLHYSGNFWWTKSSHVKKLINPISWVPDSNLQRWRMMCEMWICHLKEGKYYSAFNSGVDHYISPYPENLYIKE